MKSSVIKALQNLSDKETELFVKVIEHGSMSVEIYKPINIDPQTPHDQDELYVIINGSGDFILNDSRISFQQGDVILVPANAEHRFENFTEDFATWAIFYGPKGGEK
ncbi:cupin domain-containing protein [Mucilaginibacter celer]|uniref:Cupin domain-containing protein n=1 Tax=Mucilaginibacter celer TaxID=2305508 RepID=A0A494VKM4_9SPHI|nr:cupin domain-containing protein [Mucilaginibacter celer]AYL94994.1 cupin domain-containing protein [Mucilaginibacter celer]